MGNIYRKRKEYDKAVIFLRAATRIETGPYVDRVRYNLVLCLLNTHQETEALDQLAFLLAGQDTSNRFLTTRGFILFQQGKIDAALQHYRIALQQSPHSMDLLLNMGMALSANGDHNRAETLLKKALDQYPDNLVTHLASLQHALKTQDESRIDQSLYQITNRFKLRDIEQYLTDRARGWHYVNDTLVPVDDTIIIPPLMEYLKQIAEDLHKSRVL